jgi:outer membrane protein OmpA-like peptidoglycan-associated protein
MTKHPISGLLGAAATALLLAACATTSPESQSALDQARAAVQRFEAQPRAAQVAGKALQDARDSLAKAEAAQQQHARPEDVIHLAYLARRNADVGEAIISEQTANDAMAQAQSQRERVLLESREHETALARQQTQQAQSAAQASQQQAEQQALQAQQAQQQAQQAQQQAQDLQQQLSDLQAKQTERGMMLTLGNVLFDTNGDTLKPGADDIVSRLSQFLQQHPDIKVRIEGHTDSTGSDDYNQALSERRAQAVATALEGHGIPAQSIQAVGRGKSDPVATNASAAGRQLNRRVEIIFSDAHGQFVSG